MNNLIKSIWFFLSQRLLRVDLRRRSAQVIAFVKRKRVFIFSFITIASLCLLLGGAVYWVFVPRSVPLSQEDKAFLISHTINAILEESDVWIIGYSGKQRLGKLVAPPFNEYKTVYFVNDLGIPDSIFTDVGMVALPEGREVLVDDGEALFTVSENSYFWKFKNAIFYEYNWASLAGCDYAIRIYRSPFGSRIVYRISGVS